MRGHARQNALGAIGTRDRGSLGLLALGRGRGWGCTLKCGDGEGAMRLADEDKKNTLRHALGVSNEFRQADLWRRLQCNTLYSAHMVQVSACHKALSI